MRSARENERGLFSNSLRIERDVGMCMCGGSPDTKLERSCHDGKACYDACLGKGKGSLFVSQCCRQTFVLCDKYTHLVGFVSFLSRNLDNIFPLDRRLCRRTLLSRDLLLQGIESYRKMIGIYLCFVRKR